MAAHRLQCKDVVTVTGVENLHQFCVTDFHNLTLWRRAVTWSRRKAKGAGVFSCLSVHSATKVVLDAPVAPTGEVEK